jgi:hypothetical protein
VCSSSEHMRDNKLMSTIIRIVSQSNFIDKFAINICCTIIVNCLHPHEQFTFVDRWTCDTIDGAHTIVTYPQNSAQLVVVLNRVLLQLRQYPETSENRTL